MSGAHQRLGRARAGFSRPRGRVLAERGAHLAVLWAFAVAQPLFHQLGRAPEFFAARGSSGGDIVAVALLITFLPPLLLLAAEWLACLAGSRLGWALHLAFVGALVALLALRVVGPANAPLAFAIALALAGAGVWAYARLQAARSFLSVLAPAPFVLVVLFMWFSDVSPLVFPDVADVQAADIGARAPVVLVIFDELPVQSLMDADRRVDARRYPNFARLARDATWYRNTASVEQDTPYAVPAILDGRFPRRERLPVAADHPQNIFSLFGGDYDLHVREDATALCAPSLCRNLDRPDPDERLRSLWDDLGLVYAHLVLPDDLEGPAVTRAWDEFDEGAGTSPAVAATRETKRETKRHRYLRLHANLAAGRPERFEDFVAGIEGGPRPRLHLIHALLPHVPFQYLPSGRFYRPSPRAALPGLEGRPGYGIRFLVDQSYQRHLLQLQATDRLLGGLLDRLHRVGLYDRALVAVVADHGISFRLGHDRRLLRRANVADIAPVPFFVKAPGQRAGRISDRPLRTIDVLPTIADLLDVRIPWSVDGRSALAPTSTGQRRRRMVAKRFRHTYRVDTPSYEHDRRAALARKVRLFGHGPYAFGPRPDLLGRSVAELEPLPPEDQRAALARYPGADFVPTHLAGTIAGGVRGGGRVVAVALNGTVRATGLTFTLAGADEEQFSLLVPERALRRGRNRLELLLVGDERLRSLGELG